MSPKTLASLVSIILISNTFLVLVNLDTCQADSQVTYYVDSSNTNGPWDGTTAHPFKFIQDAVNVSSSKNKIIVQNGTYREKITVNHQLDIFGEGRDITTIDANNSGNVVTINALNVNISRFTIKNSGDSSSLIEINTGYAIITDNKLINGNNGVTVNGGGYNTIYDNIIKNNNGSGINLNNSNHNSITYNSITYNQNGIFLYDSGYNIIENNSAIKNNDLNGIFLNETSSYNSIKNNNISSNTENGIFLDYHCDNNNISNNGICRNSDSGIRIENSSSNILHNNVVQKNSNYGIMIAGLNNIIQHSTIKSNSEHGIFLFSDDFTTIFDNIIQGNTKSGIELSNSTNDTIHSNEVSDNSQYGMYLNFFTLNNLIYNNYFHDNTENADDKSLNHNTWNIAKTNGTNIVGGGNISGNYWDDFDEISEGINDTDKDGISNESYTIYASNKDNGPILDTESPFVRLPSASPGTQKIGSNTYISVVVTDNNTEIKQVHLIVVNPNGVVLNISITQNKTGNTYYCSRTYSPTGTYTYYIAAKDPLNWAISRPNQTFIIDQGTAPTITDNSPTTGSPSSTFTVNATVVDDADSPSELTVTVEWRHSSGSRSSGNYPMNPVDGNFFEADIKLKNAITPLTYRIYASDQWGNSVNTSLKTVTVVDNEAPTIVIDKNEYFSDGVQNKFTIGATIEDNHEVETAKIEYWYGDADHKTADLDKTGDYYEKVIQIESDVNKVYCIINATDPSGNENNTNSPFANTSGPYSGVTKVDVTFNGSNSFDLDGEIVEYTWNFGDGTTGTGAIANHAYSTNGTYPITLTVKDDDDNANSDTTYVNINQSIKVPTNDTILKEINRTYGLFLEDPFYSYDMDGDKVVDTFVDPNNKLKVVHTGSINISGNITFLISINDSEKPEFMWNSTTDEIIEIKNVKGVLDGEADIDVAKNIVTQDFSINKTKGWIYLEATDPDIGEYGTISGILNVTKNSSEINSDRVIRKSVKTYVLDDPETIYRFKYNYQPPVLKSVVFTPITGSTIDENNRTIIITYNVPVTIVDAAFYMIDPLTTLPLVNGTDIDIKSKLITSDNEEFSYTPPENLPEGSYEVYLFVKQKDATKTMDSSARYSYIPYAPEEMSLPAHMIWMILGGILASLAAAYALMRYKNITFESFVFVKNRKIIPFFKPLVFGPLNIDVDDKSISKAEFYLNGKLKDTITQAPYVWKLDEPMFTKQKIETKVYDQKGNSSSSGELTFYIINPPKFFK